jgi:hypothetical protein
MKELVVSTTSKIIIKLKNKLDRNSERSIRFQTSLTYLNFFGALLN